MLPVALAAASAVPGIVGGVMAYNQSKKKTPQERDIERLNALSEQYRNMLMNPNDPQFRQMVEAESEGLRQGFTGQLRELVEANRRQALLGRTQFFDPERRDESMFSALNRAGQQARIQARSNILDRINQALQGIGGQQSALAGLANLEMARRQQRQQALMAGLGALGAGIGAFGKGMQPAQSVGALA